jgi:hypothetical protein
MAPTQHRKLWPGLFYAGLVLSALVFFINLNSILQAGVQRVLGTGEKPISLASFFEMSVLPVGVMIMSGLAVLFLMHKEVQFLAQKRLDFNAPGRIGWLYALGAICLVAGAAYIAHFMQSYYGGTLQSHDWLYTLVALWVIIHGPAMTRFSTSSAETVIHLGWLRSLSVLLGMGVGMVIVYTYFSPEDMCRARQDVTKIQMLSHLQMRNMGQIRTQALANLMTKEAPPATIYISKDGQTIQEKEGKDLGHFTFKVIGTNACEICIDIKSSADLRKRIDPFNPKARGPEGEFCFKFPGTMD